MIRNLEYWIKDIFSNFHYKGYKGYMTLQTLNQYGTDFQIKVLSSF